MCWLRGARVMLAIVIRDQIKGNMPIAVVVAASCYTVFSFLQGK